MKKALIFLHGNLSDTSSLDTYISKKTFVICADGGATHASHLGIIPDVVIGDLDSITNEEKQAFENRKVTFITYPKEKDFTDAELAVKYAIDHGVREIVIAGLLGDRIDHMMANIFFLTSLFQQVDILIIEKDQEIRFTNSNLRIKGCKDDEVSLIPIQTDCFGITTEGLYYALTDAAIKVGSTRGISNVMLSEEASVRVKQGILMVIHRTLTR